MARAVGFRNALRKRVGGLVLLAPGLLIMLVLVAVPLMYLFRASFNEYDAYELMKPAFTLEHYERFLTERRYLLVLVETILYGIAVTVVTLIIGFPTAYWLSRRVRRGRQVILGLVVLPFTLNVAVLAFGWAVILGQNGLINRLLLGVGLVESPLQLMFTPAAVIIALAQALVPYQILSLMSVISRISPSLEEAAANLGAPRWRTFLLVVVPLATPGILAGCTFVFLATVTSFVTPRIVGGGSIQMLGTVIYQQIMATVNWPFAAAVSFILIAVVLATYLTANRLLRQNYLES